MKTRTSCVAFTVGLLLSPIAAQAGTAFSSWGIIVQAEDFTCGYVRTHVDSTENRGHTTMLHRDLTVWGRADASAPSDRRCRA